MRLLEYEAKAILRTGDLPIPHGEVIHNNANLSSVSLPVVIKSQVPIGGRGKLDGVVIVDQATALGSTVQKLFSLDIKGFIPNNLLLEEKLVIKKEHYLSLLIDRDEACIRLVAHRDGGVEIEDNDSDDFFNEPIEETTIIDISQKLASYLGHEGLIEPFVTNLYKTFVGSDATLIEINPLIYTETNELVCGDCKMELDDAAGFRHPEWNFEDTAQNANFVTLDQNGNVATIANGAGLAMATVDAVASAGMTPANFLDIGGGATAKSVLAAFQQIQEFPNIQAIVINIFAGITRCDQIAQAVIEAKERMPSLPPLFIRLAGTNFEEAVALLSAENIPTLSTLEDCLRAAREVTHG